MTIDEKLSELEIKKILIVDDRREHTKAAEEYFKTLPVQTDYCYSGIVAKELIKLAALEGKYHLIISDLEMETKTAGLDVVKEALKQLTYVTLATGKSYEKADTEAHGPTTTVVPSMDIIKGRKDKPEVWKQVLEKTLDHISKTSTQAVYKSARRYKELVEEVPELFVKEIFEQYKR